MMYDLTPLRKILNILTFNQNCCLLLGNSVIAVPSQSNAPPTLLLAQLFMGAGLPAGALNVLTGSDMSLGARVAKNPSISYVTYGGNKEVCVGVTVLVLQFQNGKLSCYLWISSESCLLSTKCPTSWQQTFSSFFRTGWRCVKPQQGWAFPFLCPPPSVLNVPSSSSSLPTSTALWMEW